MANSHTISDKQENKRPLSLLNNCLTVFNILNSLIDTF